uniref:PRA1 family protein n=1 Tax=Petromyzon marinus TaxID=7757 RepID=S4RR54_PETMA
MADVRFPPLRAADDFVLGVARFGAPDMSDPARWNNRIINNLLYYQSNYAASIVAIMLLVGYMRPLEMMIGGAVVAIVFLAFVLASENRTTVRRFKRNRPGLAVCAVLVASAMLLHLLGGILVFVFGITFPLLLVLIHASLRLRNLKNKLSNKMENIGLKRTPMGLLLEALGQESEAGS